MGYGSRALQLLQMYYEGKFPTMDESAQSNHNEITSVSSEVRHRCFQQHLLDIICALEV